MLNNKKGQDGESIFEGMIIIGFLYVVAIIYLSIPTPTEEECRTNITETPIYSMNLNSGLSGGFFLGIGGFSENTYYYYYKLDDSGGKILDKSDAEYVRIIEDDKNPPALLEYSFSGNIKCPNQVVPKPAIRVPSNTIKQKYNIDLDKV